MSIMCVVVLFILSISLSLSIIIENIYERIVMTYQGVIQCDNRNILIRFW